MEISTIAWTITAYIKTTLATNFIFKFIVSIFVWYITVIYNPNMEVFKAMIAVFCIDWFLWTLRSFKMQTFSSTWFRKWALKLASYIMLVYAWYSMDLIMPYDAKFFINTMFLFVILTDVSSILENLEDLWIPVPFWLRRFLQIHKDKIFTDTIKKITWYDINNPYLDDLKQIEVYIDHIPDNDMKKLFKIKFVHLRRIIMDLLNMEVRDLDWLKIKIDLIFQDISPVLEKKLYNSWCPIDKIDKFWNSHQERFRQLIEQLNITFDWNKWSTDKEMLRQIKINVIQQIIMIVYKNVSDKFDLSFNKKIK